MRFIRFDPLVLYLFLLIVATLSWSNRSCVVGGAVVESSDQSVCSANDDAIAFAHLNQQGQEQLHPDGVGSYHLHGWRWHGMAVLREIKLLQTLLQQEASHDDDETTKQSLPPTSSKRACHFNVISSVANYSIGFNLKGLHHIESTIFFPWLALQFETRIQDQTTRDAFQRILDTMQEYQEQIHQQGQIVVRVLDTYCDAELSHVFTFLHMCILLFILDS